MGKEKSKRARKTFKNHIYLGLFIVGANPTDLNTSKDITVLQNKRCFHK